MIGDSWTGTPRSYQFLDLFQSPGAKRYYPFGDDGLWASSGALVRNDDGNWDAALTTLTDLNRNAYRGLIAECSGAASIYFLQIQNNQADSLVLRDHRGNQQTAPDGDYLIKALYFPLEIDMPNMDLVFEEFDVKANPLYPQFDFTVIDGYENQDPDDHQHWEGNVRGITFREVETDV